MDQESIRAGLKERLLKLKSRLIRKNVAIFGFFLLLSALFWYLNALSKDMTLHVDYPVRYINFPGDMALLNELPEMLDLQLEGPGYSLLQIRFKANKPPLVIDISSVNKSVTESRGKYSFYVLTYTWGGMIARQMRSDFSVSSINPDTIFFEFDQISHKVVEVVPDVEVSTMRQFMVYGKITCNPDSIEITGPKIIVDTIESVKTKNQKFQQLNQSYTGNIQLESIKKITLSEKKVEITIPVEQYTEAVFTIPVTVIGEPDSVRVRVFPDKINLQCIVTLSDYSKLREASIEAVVDMTKVDPGSASMINVELRNVPDYAGGLKYNPGQVEYILEKK